MIPPTFANPARFGRARAGAFLLFAAAIITPALLRAQVTPPTLYWDTNDNTAGAGTSPNGEWTDNHGAPRRNWSTSSAGTVSTQAWSNGSFANFSAGSDATGAFTVNVSGMVNAAGISIVEGHPTFTGGALGLVASSAGAAPFINAGTSATFNNPLSGTAGLNLNGPGTVVLAGANTYSGATTISSGTLRLGANSVIPDASAVVVASGAVFDLNNYSDTVGAISGAGTVRTGSGALTLGAGMNFNGTLELNGGTLNLAGFSSTLGTLSVTASSVLDFGNAVGSTLNVITSIQVSSSATLTVANWTASTDYFYARFGDPGSDIRSRIAFSGYPGAGAKWMSFDTQITPVPEPSLYGACLLGLSALAGATRLRRREAA